MKHSKVLPVCLFVLLVTLLFPALAARKGEAPALYSIYWPWESCAPENPFCVALETIDLKTGRGSHANTLLNDFTPDPTTGWSPFGVAFDVDGTLYTITSWTDLVSRGYGRLARVNPSTGDLAYVGPVHDINFAGPEIDACGNLFATGFTVGDPATPGIPLLFGDSFLYRFDKDTGERTAVGDTGRTDWMDLAFDSRGQLWATTDNMLFLLDPLTGASTFVTNIVGVPTSDIPGTCVDDWPYMEVMTIAFDANDVLFATAIRGFSLCFDLNAPFMKIDVATGMASVLGYTSQVYNHGGDIDLRKVKVCHRADSATTVPLLVDHGSLQDHLVHGDVVPGYPCDCG